MRRTNRRNTDTLPHGNETQLWAKPRPQDKVRAVPSSPHRNGVARIRATMAARHRRSGLLFRLRLVRQTWSICGAERRQTGATYGEPMRPDNRLDATDRSRVQAVATPRAEMVRRGSTVRVRQRASG